MADAKTLVVIGAGSITFTPKLLRDILHHPKLAGGTVRLVDIDAGSLDTMARLAQRLFDTARVHWTIEQTVDRREALPGADYVLISADIERVDTWEKDFRIPVECGIRQVTGELGGPGGLFHSLRQIPIHVEMARDAAELCPGAIVMVESNPLNRICLAMRRYSDCGQILGLCHGVEIAQSRLGRVLGMDTDDLLATAAGVNHFTWILDLRDRATGRDLYPQLRQALLDYDETFWPLSRKLFDVYGLFPSCGDEHIGEYLPYAHEFVGLGGPDFAHRAESAESFRAYAARIAAGEGPIEEYKGTTEGVELEERMEFFFSPRSWVDTLAMPIINAIHTNVPRRMPAVNMVNEGAVGNLPRGVFVETPALVDASGCRPLAVGDLPTPLAALCRRDIDQAKVIVEAAMTGDRRAILQAMLLDPVVDSIAAAERTLDQMLRAHAEHLPHFA
jgi:alpha-galactosidase